MGAVSFDSAAYCARYVLKKITGEVAAAHYRTIDPETGEVFHLLPEYCTMSLKPAIGKGWFTEFSADVYPSDFLIVEGRRHKPPRYYDKQLDTETCASIKEIRKAFAVSQFDNNSKARLAVRESVLNSKLKMLKREI